MERSLIDQFRHSVELDGASLDLFELSLEKEILSRLKEIRELFDERQDLRLAEISWLHEEARELERIFAEDERWELCARVRDQRNLLLKEIGVATKNK
jgi:hypothetical protein